MITFAIPLFAPNDELFEKQKKSIQSLCVFDLKDYKLVAGGYVKEKYRSELSNLLNEYNIVFKFFDENIGKAKTVNKLLENDNSDYILTFDSDIIHLKDNLDEMVCLAKLIPNFTYFSAVQLEHSTTNIHLLSSNL